MRKVAVIAGPASWQVGHGPAHPLKPERLAHTFRLWETLGLLQAENITVIAPRLAAPDELKRFHTAEYVDLVERLGRGELSSNADRYGFGPGDNPVFLGMFESEGRKVGAALQAADQILHSEADVAFSFTGGLHHGGPDFVCGFCVFNDIVIAIYRLLDHSLRVAYIDVDVHHGDGVQDAFYQSDKVLTISLHQDGRTLFPGTGAIEEMGAGPGAGFTVNVPLPPFTDDEQYLFAFDETVHRYLDRFEPDVVVTQLGVDTHFKDPLAQLALTTQGHQAIFQRLQALCDPWLAFGGGGYNLDVVPRSWTLALEAMAGLELPEKLPASVRTLFEGPDLHDSERPLVDSQVRRRNQETIEATVSRLNRLHAVSMD